MSILILLMLSCKKDQEIGSVKDIDGNVYETVTIGSQTWMKENLRTTRYSDGSNIPNVVDYNEWVDRTEEGFCWYKNDPAYKSLGALYNFYVVVDPRNVCPEGWHVPSDKEWNTLEALLGLPLNDLDKIGMRGTNQGDFLKATYGWFNYGNGNNITGFSAIPSGVRFFTGFEFDDEGFSLGEGYAVSFWSPAKNPPENHHYKSLCRILFYKDKGIGRGGGLDWAGYPLRCVKD